MGMFDYKDYSSEEAAQLVDDAQRLSAYTNASSFFYLPGDDLLNLLGTITGDLFPNDTNVAIPDGWKELTPTDLGVSDDLVDGSGYFKIASFYTGTAVEGPQAKIFAQYDDAGNITRVNLNFCGTNNITDIIDYLNLNSREGVELLDPILNIVKDFALANGLSAKDVLISGYSLGAGIVNVMAEDRATLADGFFAQSDYMAFEVPKIYENPDVVLNVGYENDVVHRIAGDATSFLGAVNEMGFGFTNTDRSFEGTTDNLVLFNDVYASPIWDISPFSLLNIPVGWYAHLNGVTTDALTRIKESTFYEFTKQDSTVIVDDLTAVSRGTTWVRDKATHTSDHYNSAAFIIGTEYNDLIQGGKNSDYIDAGLGDDIIRAGLGVDHVDGNYGRDEIRLEGRGNEWDVYQMQDHTLFFIDKDGINLVEADNVESVSFDGELLSHTNNYSISDHGLIDHRPLMNWLDNDDKPFLAHVEGTANNDTLSGAVVFGRAGDDQLTGLASDDILHGGFGNDTLFGAAGSDRLYGAEGDDVLNGGAGNDILVGGIGNDTFVIDKLSGSDVIADFNNDVGYHDTIQFSSELFTDSSALAAQTTQSGSDVIVALGGGDYLTITNSHVDDVLASAVLA